MEFCPTCANMLQVEPPHVGRRARFFCPTCPYVYSIEQKITKKERLAKKKEEAIYSKDDEMKNAPKTQVPCPTCGHGEANFKQLQIRSADEPMTTFYRCCSCSHEWRED